MNLSMNLSDLNLQNLRADNIGSWPVPVKGFFIVLTALLVLGGGWYMDTQDQRDALLKVEKQELDLKRDFEAKQKKAVNLEPLKMQLEDIKQSFGDMLRRLPNKTEVAGLLVDISQQGLGAGLEFELFKPGAEQPAEFYVQLPIQIRVTGSYHQFGRFISGVADLPRIVTQHDVRIRNVSKGKNVDRLTMETTARTYRYMDEEEEAAEAKARRERESKNGKGKGKGKGAKK